MTTVIILAVRPPRGFLIGVIVRALTDKDL
jgi:hypothetical protein